MNHLVGARQPPSGRSRWQTAAYLGGIGIVAWILLVSIQRGRALERMMPEIKLGAAPLVGRDPVDGWDWRFGAGLVGATALAVALVAAVLAAWTVSLRLRTLVISCSVGATAFALCLALTDGFDGVLNGAEHRTEYLANLPNTPPAGEFVRSFVEDIDLYSVHVRGHPPGFVLVVKFIDAIGLHGPWPVAMLSVMSVAVVVAATLTTVWAVAGADWTRRSAPFLVVSPYALWQVTSADAFYCAVSALGVMLVALGLRRRDWTAMAAGLGAGVLLGSLLYLTYLGAIFVMMVAPLTVASTVRRRPGTWPTVAGVAAGASAVIGGFAAAGFWWVDGARRTRTEYWDGTAQFRDWGYFKYGNLAAAIIAIGPAAIVGLMRLRDRRVWLISGGALAALAASHLSQYTRAEVERIWLLFFPWLVIAAGALAVRCRPRAAAGWVAVQATSAVVLQAALVSKW